MPRKCYWKYSDICLQKKCDNCEKLSIFRNIINIIDLNKYFWKLVFKYYFTWIFNFQNATRQTRECVFRGIFIWGAFITHQYPNDWIENFQFTNKNHLRMEFEPSVGLTCWCIITLIAGKLWRTVWKCWSSLQQPGRFMSGKFGDRTSWEQIADIMTSSNQQNLRNQSKAYQSFRNQTKYHQTFF